MPDISRSYTYFASDFHLGVDLALTSEEREKIIVSWLNKIKPTARAIYLVGDIFDYWFEYKSVIPKGFIRLQGTLASLSDNGVEVHFIKGNHDMWVYSYFEKELGLIIHDNSIKCEIDGKIFIITHGDGLGSDDKYYKTIKKLLRNRIAQKLFSLFHPNIGLSLMIKMSKRSRKKELQNNQNNAQQAIIKYASSLLHSNPFDFFICGHYHHPLIMKLSNTSSEYCNLGDWMTHFSYAIWDGEKLLLTKYPVSK